MQDNGKNLMVNLFGKKILLIKLRYIGDTMSLIPVVENLKEKTHDLTLDVMVNKGTEEVLAYNPDISKLWVYDRAEAKKNILSSIGYHKKLIKQLRSRKYDAVIDYTHGDRTAFLSFLTGAPQRITCKNSSVLSHVFMNRIVSVDPFKYHIVDYQLESLKIFGLDHFKKEIRLYVPGTVETKVDHLLSGAGIAPDSLRIVIHPGARGRLRQWRPDRFAAIAGQLKNKYQADIIIIGGPNESDLIEQVEREMGFSASFKSTELSLLEMAALLKRSLLFIGNDSAPGHIAAAVACPNLTLFGPTFPHMWRPLSPVGEVVFKNVSCCGCRQERCSRQEENCMDMIGVDEVWDKTVKLLAELGRSP